jgi:hypothetical protein
VNTDMMGQIPTNDRQALTMALVLGITAPTEAKSEAAIDLAKRLAAGMTDKDIAWCKKQALKEIQRGPTHV